jgi:hypothetical protein
MYQKCTRMRTSVRKLQVKSHNNRLGEIFNFQVSISIEFPMLNESILEDCNLIIEWKLENEH